MTYRNPCKTIPPACPALLARSRHSRPLGAKVVSPALSVVCAGDSLQIRFKREALQKINWNERPKACRNIVSPFSSLPDRTLYFDLRPRFCYVSGIAHRKLYGNMLFLNMFEACLSAWFTKVPPTTCMDEPMQGIEIDFQVQFQGIGRSWRLWLANARRHFSWHGRPPATPCKIQESKKGATLQGLKKMRAAAKSLSWSPCNIVPNCSRLLTHQPRRSAKGKSRTHGEHLQTYWDRRKGRDGKRGHVAFHWREDISRSSWQKSHIEVFTCCKQWNCTSPILCKVLGSGPKSHTVGVGFCLSWKEHYKSLCVFSAYLHLRIVTNNAKTAFWVSFLEVGVFASYSYCSFLEKLAVQWAFFPVQSQEMGVFFWSGCFFLKNEGRN